MLRHVDCGGAGPTKACTSNWFLEAITGQEETYSTRHQQSSTKMAAKTHRSRSRAKNLGTSGTTFTPQGHEDATTTATDETNVTTDPSRYGSASVCSSGASVAKITTCAACEDTTSFRKAAETTTICAEIATCTETRHRTTKITTSTKAYSSQSAEVATYAASCASLAEITSYAKEKDYASTVATHTKESHGVTRF